MAANKSITSPNGTYKLLMQGDGNLVEYHGSTAIWASGTSGSGTYALMQGDGNLVIYNASNKALWASGTSGNPGAFVSLTTGGVLTIDSFESGVLWTS